jgi:SAM-dependent methyltransferase
MPESHRLEHYRRRYAALRPGWRSATARLERSVASALTANSRVLDLGCGRGGIVERLGPQGAGGEQTARWAGVDPDISSLWEHRSGNLRRACANAEELPFSSGTFDIVIASWVLEHLPRPAATFREIARVMRRGGSFFFLTPNATHPLPRLSAAIAPLHRFQQRIVAHFYGRGAADTFPVTYRANTVGAISRLSVRVGLRPVEIAWVDDPSYFAWDQMTFMLAVMAELLLPPTWQVHIVGHLQKR